MDGRPELVLASGSPRRTELLALLGLCFRSVAADIDESVITDESPSTYVSRLAFEKARSVAAALDPPIDPAVDPGPEPRPAPEGPNLVVIGADTAVVVDDDILGKPADGPEARAMLRRLSGRSHEVRTGLAVVHGQDVAETVVSTFVWFTDLDDTTIDWYVATNEPLDKAGAYGIQAIGGVFVEAIQGSYHNVVGLPLVELDQLVADLGFRLRDWST